MPFWSQTALGGHGEWPDRLTDRAPRSSPFSPRAQADWRCVATGLDRIGRGSQFGWEPRAGREVVQPGAGTLKPAGIRPETLKPAGIRPETLKPAGRPTGPP